MDAGTIFATAGGTGGIIAIILALYKLCSKGIFRSRCMVDAGDNHDHVTLTVTHGAVSPAVSKSNGEQACNKGNARSPSSWSADGNTGSDCQRSSESKSATVA